MNLSLLFIYLLVTNIAQGLPIQHQKRWSFFDLFDSQSSASAVATTLAPTPAVIPATTPAPVQAPVAVTTPVAVATPVQVVQLAATPSVAPQTTAAAPAAAAATASGTSDGSSWLANPTTTAATTQPQPEAAAAEDDADYPSETTITRILTVTRTGYSSDFPASNPTQASQPTTTTSSSSSSTGGGFLNWLAGLFGSSSSSSSSTQTTTVQPDASQVVSSDPSSFIEEPVSIPDPQPVSYPASSQVSIPSASASSINLSFQGGSPGKNALASSMATASAINGGSNAGAAAAVGSKGITYSPYTKTDQCKSASDVASDIAKLSNFDVIRLYSTDCSGIENVLSAMSSHQQLFLGVWNVDSVQGELQDIVTAISGSSRGWSAVHTIAIGNERVNAGAATVADIQNAVSQSRVFLKQNAPQYTGPIVSVDTLVAVVGNPALCEVSDYLAVNSHPYWDGGVQPENSGPWLQQQIANLQNVCGKDKQVLITETGWPTQGDTFGSCVPSVPNQVAAIKSIVNSLGSQVIMFTMYNDYWKDPGPYNVEQHWGIFGDPAE
ncbi:uncharacterized protein SPAPADRAFT_57962 [Spathaspora passalidarum NRRL Y-27907]|uniref:Uncharacterized protein n=1 Tax=Spathaspora passalidarum (strain NRRL Y-27907 / 11-Y1) TaxID=619300 RepID=G3AF81_SPAPN|nr:uncharacterized protein SPAPADRAFT_57962 [Spathaspora passalidarum NRRL Y-27907]EGW34870.1 hypothetical protein SPAPADRAFT_57962 [Spathaspora passalidarum NRRL Y-27907]